MTLKELYKTADYQERKEIIMCEFNRYKNEILWCTPMNAPCIKCVDKYPKIYEKIKKIAKEYDGSDAKFSKTDGV